MHADASVGTNKASSGRDACLRINPDANVRVHQQFLNKDNAVEIVRGYDVVIDATDNVVARYLVNDACVLANKPLVSGTEPHTLISNPQPSTLNLRPLTLNPKPQTLNPKP
jgi:molybdopterin/thiamine biosynthesis adenylyltransferase